MKILVTGGLGFIGSNFCRYIIAERPSDEIVNIDKEGIGANPANLKDLEKNKKYTFIKGDICDSKLLDKTVKKADAIINFAAERTALIVSSDKSRRP